MPGRNARNLGTARAVAHDQIFGKDAQPLHRLHQPERVEHVKHVGAELNACTDFAKRVRLLEHH
jgi:hypothetical protein